ncbi:uncharacterized protein LOC143283835 [Babylonia areolata]|uniref:uncharacterized protein LOC143283835 n=1 Tax=Babylonia areolata TaxID=304850 RepID=UPI003FCF6101
MELMKQGVVVLLLAVLFLAARSQSASLSGTPTQQQNASRAGNFTTAMPNTEADTNYNNHSRSQTSSTSTPTAGNTNDTTDCSESSLTKQDMPTSLPMQEMTTDQRDCSSYPVSETTNTVTTTEASVPTSADSTTHEVDNLTLIEFKRVFEEFHPPIPPFTPHPSVAPPAPQYPEEAHTTDIFDEVTSSPEIDDPPVSVDAETSPFDQAEETFPDFESQAMAVHLVLCRTSCYFTYHLVNGLPARGCSMCFCDHLCHVYGDCCPDLQLLHTSGATAQTPVTWEDTRRLTQGREVYTCEISHLKRTENEGDYDNNFSMVNYCPRENVTRSTSPANTSKHDTAGQDPMTKKIQTLEDQCENRGNSSHWLFVRPWTSREGVVYRNQFCAQCHGQDISTISPWVTTATCNGDILRSATSSKEAYLLAVNTPGCDIRFTSNEADTLRRCSSLRPPILSSCNQTGLWRNYDARVARACTSFTAPVLQRYRNAFCLLCNVDMPFWEVLQLLQVSWYPSNIARASFFALLDVDDEPEDEAFAIQSLSEDGEDDASGDQECGVGELRDPLQHQCRAVKCGQGLRVDGDNCTDVFSSTNYFGFNICTRLRLQSEAPIPGSGLEQELFYQLSHQGRLEVPFAEGFPRLDCEDITAVTIDIRADVFSYSPIPLKDIAEDYFQAVDALVSGWSADPDLNLTALTPIADCETLFTWHTSIPDTCPTKRETNALGIMVSHRPFMSGYDTTQLSFLPLYNTTFCPHINLTEAEFKNYTEALRLLNLTEASLKIDVVSEGNSFLYLICKDDYLLVERAPNYCTGCVVTPGWKESVGGFQDTWTPVGLISTVSTCVSLLCLLAVVVTYLTLAPLRAGSGQSTLAMACVLFVAQALHEVGIEQFEIPGLCLALALLIHVFWLAAVFMMSSCTLQLFLSMRLPLWARTALSSGKVVTVSLLSSFGLSAAVVCLTMAGNKLVHGDLGYPASYLCFIRRSLSRQLGFGLPLGLVVLLNVLLFLITIVHVHKRPNVSCTRQDRISLLACFRLSVVTGLCWLSLFLMALPGTRPWLEYVFVLLLGLQGLLLATTLLLNKRVYSLWKEHFKRRSKVTGSQKSNTLSGSNSKGARTGSPATCAVTGFSSLNEMPSDTSSDTPDGKEGDWQTSAN